MQAALDKIINDAVGSGKVPWASAAVSKGGKTVYTGAAGTTQLGGAGDKVSAETPARIMSMTKIMTSVGLLQLVEQGKLDPEATLASVLPQFEGLHVLTDFDGDKPVTRPISRQPTIKEVMSHSSGLSYDFLDAKLRKYCEVTGNPSIFLQQRAGIYGSPAVHDPSAEWTYGVNIDVGGFIIEKLSGHSLADYLKANVFDKLGMKSTYFGIPEGNQVHLRQPDGSLVPLPMPPAPAPDFDMGGGGLTSTLSDYLTFINDLLSGSSKLLSQATIDKYVKSNVLVPDLHIRNLPANYPYNDERSFIPGTKIGHSMAAAVSLESVPGMRPKGSFAWAGLLNSYFWADAENNVVGVLFTQLLPFADKEVVAMLEDMEKAVYSHL